MIFHALFLVCVFSFLWLKLSSDADSTWKILMETSGFVDWPELHLNSLHVLAAATLLVVTDVSCVVVPWSLITRSAKGVKIFVWAIALTICMSIAPLTMDTPSLSKDAIELLATQTNAVANFNRGFCHAWCQVNEAGLASLMRGDCGPMQKTVFDQPVAKFDINDWCLEAIAQQKFELVAAYTGMSPFASLKGDAGDKLTAPLSYFFLANVIVGLGMIAPTIFLAKTPFSRKSRPIYYRYR